MTVKDYMEIAGRRNEVVVVYTIDGAMFFIYSHLTEKGHIVFADYDSGHHTRLTVSEDMEVKDVYSVEYLSHDSYTNDYVDTRFKSVVGKY